MKKIIVTAVIFVFAAHVNAQTGMPQALTCTERALNFSFSIGTKWNLIAPKMGPVEATRSRPDYIPAWSLKLNHVLPETLLLPLIEKPFNVEALGYPVNRQNYFPLSYHNGFGMTNNPDYLLPVIKPGPSIIYKVVWPNILGNSIRYGP